MPGDRTEENVTRESSPAPRPPAAPEPESSPPPNIPSCMTGGDGGSVLVYGPPVQYCVFCDQEEGMKGVPWTAFGTGRPYLRYLCERKHKELESHHHLDIPTCAVCTAPTFIYHMDSLLGPPNTRKMYKFALKCLGGHVLPLLDLHCTSLMGKEPCPGVYRLEWSGHTMVKRCTAQRNRDHDLWWFRYKGEWKQRRTYIRYNKEFLSRLTEEQRRSIMGLSLEGEITPDPPKCLGRTYEELLDETRAERIDKRTAQRRSRDMPY